MVKIGAIDGRIKEKRKIVGREIIGKRKVSTTIRKRIERKIAREKGTETERVIMKRTGRMIIRNTTDLDQEINIHEDEIMILYIQSIIHIF